MKKLIYIGLAITLLQACTSNENSAESKTATDKPAEEKVLVLPYNAEYNAASKKLDMKHNTAGDAAKLSAVDMIDAINIKYPEIKLQLEKSSRDTIFLKISDARYLSQTMGTAGSKAYMAESTYALTELKGIKVVGFMFTEGDHASPGIFTRASFKNEVVIK